MKFINLGFSLISLDEVKAIYETISDPIKKMGSQYKNENKFLNLSFGQATRSYIELKDGRLISCSDNLEKLLKQIIEV